MLDHTAGHTVLEEIMAMYDAFFQAEKKVADFILANPNTAVNSNVSELANSSGVSDATIIRFCKRLGYEGYYQMRLLLARDLGRQGHDPVPSNSGDTSVQILFRDIAETTLAVAASTDESVFREAAELLKHCSMAHLVATGNTTSLCQDMGPRLEQMGIRCTYSVLAEHYMRHIELGSSTDVIVAISGSGTSKNVVKALNLAREKGMKSIAVTAFQYSPVSRIADCLLLSTPKGQADHSLFRVSRLNEMIVLEVLARMLESAIGGGNDALVESEFILSGTKY